VGARQRVAVAFGAVALVLTIVVGPAAHASGPGACGWPMYGHDPGHSFAQAPNCSTVTVQTAPTLTPKWVYPTSQPVSASPAIVDSTVYVGDWSGTFYALPTDPPPGPVTPRWTYKVDDTNGFAFGRIESSAAYVSIGGRHVVLFGGGATLYALDADTGTKLAGVCLDPRADPAVRCKTPDVEAEIESSPAVVQRGGSTLVLAGIDVHNDENVGRTGVVALALRSTKSGVSLTPVWKFDPEAGVPYTGDDELTRGSGTGTGCAGVWSSPAVDVARDLVFFGTASCSVDGVAVGEHMWAIRLDTGALAWSYGPPRESTRDDDDFGASPNLLPGGMVGEASKDGWYYALDEQAGPNHAPRLRWKTHVGESGHLQQDFAVGGAIGTPATGTVNGGPAIFVTTAISTPFDAPLDSGPTIDQSLTGDPARLLSLAAISATDGTVLWRAPLSRQSYGAPTFVNGVVLVPSTFDSTLAAFAADTGLPLAMLPVVGPPASAPTPVGNSIYMGAGTGTGTDSPLSDASGVWAFEVASP
jgi:outer membrane protein assembly factor BamB